MRDMGGDPNPGEMLPELWGFRKTLPNWPPHRYLIPTLPVCVLFYTHTYTSNLCAVLHTQIPKQTVK